jgi:hypothetical protein
MYNILVLAASSSPTCWEKRDISHVDLRSSQGEIVAGLVASGNVLASTGWEIADAEHDFGDFGCVFVVQDPVNILLNWLRHFERR